MHITLREILKIPLFKPFRGHPRKIQQLLSKVKIQYFCPKAIILKEGDSGGGALYVVVHGSVGIAKTIDFSSGRSKTLGVIRKGEFFGEMSLFDASERSATVYALEDTYLLVVRAKVFNALVRQDVELSSNLLFSVIGVLSNRLKRANMELVVLYETGKAISKNLNLTELCAAIIECLTNSLETSGGCLIVFNELSGQFEQVATLGRCITDGSVIESLVSYLRRKHQGLVLPSQDDEQELSSLLHKTYPGSHLIVPLTRKKRVYGAIILSRDILLKEDSVSPPEKLFSDAEFNLVLGVAQQVSFAVENARVREEESARSAYSRRSSSAKGEWTRD
jgi:CRP-like cAMP-binding protein